MEIKKKIYDILCSFREENQVVKKILDGKSTKEIYDNIVVVNIPYVSENGETFYVPTYGYITDKFIVSQKLGENYSKYEGEENYMSVQQYKILVFSGFNENYENFINYFRIFGRSDIYDSIEKAFQYQKNDIERYIDVESKKFPAIKGNLFFEFIIEKELDEVYYDLYNSIDESFKDIVKEKYPNADDIIRSRYIK